MSFIARIVRPTARVLSTRGLVNAVARRKHTLPDLKYDYAELEPSISGKIMEVCKEKARGSVQPSADMDSSITPSITRPM
jgi:hypothetical protein